MVAGQSGFWRPAERQPWGAATRRASMMEQVPLSRTAALRTGLLGEDRCDINHPIRPSTSCSLHVGHGSYHQSSTVEGESSEWA